MKSKLIIASGYFNPLHKGHIEYLNKAKKLGDLLLVIVNNDFQRKLKNSVEFYNEEERCIIISNLKVVDEVFLSIDKTRSVVESLKIIHSQYSDKYQIIFTNGGDQSFENSPESQLCDNLSIIKIDGLGDKIQSSSWLLNK